MTSYRSIATALNTRGVNVFAYNRDDHTKNHSFMMPSPVYDVTFSMGPVVSTPWASRAVDGTAFTTMRRAVGHRAAAPA